jgi:hypothetical protein
MLARQEGIELRDGRNEQLRRNELLSKFVCLTKVKQHVFVQCNGDQAKKT